MPRTQAVGIRRTASVTQIPQRVNSNVTLFDGSGLNVDYGTYLAQHDIVYLNTTGDGSQGMPVGDGDLGAMLWCPGRVQAQLQKCDLWNDPLPGSPADSWQQVSAGAISISSDPSFFDQPTRFVQRLSLHSGVITVEADNSQGSCQVTAFVAATAGVLVIRYRDQTVRGADRRVDISLDRSAHLFARGETVGILQAFRDRRYALLARVAGHQTQSAKSDSNNCSLVLGPGRSSDFTLYVAVATSPSNGDPVTMAQSRIQSAAEKGFERLLSEQRQHWSLFWEKSFLRLSSNDEDPLPQYVENLWYFGLYQQASCSRGFDAPLANGGLWLGAEDTRKNAAVYHGQELRTLMANLISSNHLELSVPYVDTYFRMLPELAARTGSKFGMGGARLPAVFNRFGDDLAPGDRSDWGDKTDRTDPTDTSSASQLTALCEGLDTGLLIWEAWRHAPDPFFLRERAYPLLRAVTVFAIEYCQSEQALWQNTAVRARIAAAVRALQWADKEYELGEELRADWQRLTAELSNEPRYRPPALQPFGEIKPQDAAAIFRSLLDSTAQLPCGLFGEHRNSPDLAFSARLCLGLTGLLLNERSITSFDPSEAAGNAAAITGFGGAAPAAIRVFPSLPPTWSAAFSFSAPGGFRISAEAAEGTARYVAIKSLLGGVCAIVNPWSIGERVRVVHKKTPIFETTAPIITIATEPNMTYVIERQDMPLSRAAVVRLAGKQNIAPLACGEHLLGIRGPIDSTASPRSASRLRLESPTPSPPQNTSSRIDLARGRPPRL